VPGLAEIAEAAGVGISTGCRVLRRRAGVPSPTRARVLAVVPDRPRGPASRRRPRLPVRDSTAAGA
jgi:hypothetical protein